jgi:hypothetical protein
VLGPASAARTIGANGLVKESKPTAITAEAGPITFKPVEIVFDAMKTDFDESTIEFDGMKTASSGEEIRFDAGAFVRAAALRALRA